MVSVSVSAVVIYWFQHVSRCLLQVHVQEDNTNDQDGPDPARHHRESRVYEFDRVISAIPAHSLATVLPVAGEELRAIPFETLATVNFAWDRRLRLTCGDQSGGGDQGGGDQGDAKRSGVTAPPPPLMEPCIGYLAPGSERVPELGVVVDTHAFPQRQPYPSTVLTVILGGHRFVDVVGRPLADCSEHTLLHIARDVLRKRLGIRLLRRPDQKVDQNHQNVDHPHDDHDEEPTEHLVRIHHKCTPQYHVGHEDLLQRIDGKLQEHYKGRVHLIGASYRGIGIPDCIHGAYQLVDQLANQYGVPDEK